MLSGLHCVLIEGIAVRRMLSPFAGCVKEQTRRGGQSSLGSFKSGYEAATPIPSDTNLTTFLGIIIWLLLCRAPSNYEAIQSVLP